MVQHIYLRIIPPKSKGAEVVIHQLMGHILPLLEFTGIF